MLNPKKWDYIAYGDIKAGDKIKVITTGKTPNLATKTVTTATVGCASFDAWYVDNIRITSDPSNKDSHFMVEIYRRKPKTKPFDFPKNFGAIIQVAKSIDPESVGHRTIRGNGYFVLCQSGMWRNETGEGFNVNELVKFFTGFTLVSTGVTV
jgi:hypothetical protein